MKDEPRQAWYSSTQAERVGTIIWAREDGTEVEITCVDDTKPLFDDIEDRGLVVRSVRLGRLPNRVFRWNDPSPYWS